MRSAPTRAERRARTRAELIDAAERLFSERGYHATSLDAVADDAGFTKGAVYSNFASKEDLFFAVYERRVDRFLPHADRTFAEAADAADGMLRMAAEAEARRGRDDGWLAAFLEFWTHVLRHPEHRERFAAIHARAADPFVRATTRFAAEHGIELPLGARQLSVALFAMATGLAMERLTQPDVAAPELGVRMQELWLEALVRGWGAPAEQRGASDAGPRI